MTSPWTPHEVCVIAMPHWSSPSGRPALRHGGSHLPFGAPRLRRDRRLGVVRWLRGHPGGVFSGWKRLKNGAWNRRTRSQVTKNIKKKCIHHWFSIMIPPSSLWQTNITMDLSSERHDTRSDGDELKYIDVWEGNHHRWGGDFQKLDFIPEGRLWNTGETVVDGETQTPKICIDMFDSFTMFNFTSNLPSFWFLMFNFHADVFSFFGPASSNNVLNIPAIQYAPIPLSSRKLEWRLLVFEEKSMPFLRFVF